MKEVDPKKFGARVRARRIARKWSQKTLGDASGYSQTNIGWIESGKAKRPRASVAALSEALMSPVDWLLWGIGPETFGPTILTGDQVKVIYNGLPQEKQAAVSATLSELSEPIDKNRKSG